MMHNLQKCDGIEIMFNQSLILTTNYISKTNISQTRILALNRPVKASSERKRRKEGEVAYNAPPAVLWALPTVLVFYGLGVILGQVMELSQRLQREEFVDSFNNKNAQKST